MNLDVMERLEENAPAADGNAGAITFRESLASGAAALANVTAGYSVYEQRLTAVPPVAGFNLEPYTVYFYYVRLDSDGRLRVKHYTRLSATAIPHASLEQVVQEMVDNVRNGDNAWASDGKNFSGIEWTRKSYIAFFVDEDNWDLHKNGNGAEGIRFVTSGTPNHSFFDAVDLKATVVNRTSGVITRRSAIAFVNHMKRNSQGADVVAGDRQTFKFEMIFDVKFADLSTAPLVVIFDPEGTNVGPPVSPP